VLRKKWEEGGGEEVYDTHYDTCIREERRRWNDDGMHTLLTHEMGGEDNTPPIPHLPYQVPGEPTGIRV